MREMLAVALARQIGKTLTLELACEIGREAASQPDCSVDPWQFAPERDAEGRTYQCERLADGGLELRQQRSAYLHETSAGDPIRINWSRVHELNRTGKSVIFTVRDAEGVLLGSVWLLLGENVDTGRSAVTDDLLYVDRAHRDGMLGIRLLRFAERCIFALGVREATFHFRLENGADSMARFLGYRPVSTRVKKTHDGDTFADVPTRHSGVIHGSAA